MTINTLIKEGNRLSKRLLKSERIMSAIESEMNNWWDPDEVTKKSIRELLTKGKNHSTPFGDKEIETEFSTLEQAGLEALNHYDNTK